MIKVFWLTICILASYIPASVVCQPCKTVAEWKDVQDERNRCANAKVKSKTIWSVTYKGYQVEKTKERRIEFAPTGEEVREIEYYKNGLVRYQFDCSYDDSGRMLVSKVQFQGKPAGHWEYEYNSAGLVTSHKFIDTIGTVTRRYFYQYLDTSEILITKCDSSGSTLCAIMDRYEGHRDSGILIGSTREIPNGIRDKSLVHEYISGRWSAETTLNRNNEVIKETQREYDDNGNLKKTIVIDGFGEKATETTFRYSNKGLLELIETRDGLGYLKSRVQFDYEYYN